MDGGDGMSYFLKKSKLKNGMYLQIYESYYDPQRKYGAHRSYKALGYVEKLKEAGIADPIAYYSEEVEKLNAESKATKQDQRIRKISDETPERYVGYFPIKAINEALDVRKLMNLIQVREGFKFNVFDMMSALIYARIVKPCSKNRTYNEILPKLAEEITFSQSQMYEGLAYLGREYERIIEYYNHQIGAVYQFDTASTYFDCTNFYFEIDKEDDFRRKGPSKENRREPIVGMGLLLDAHQIPICMRLYPGNESEKPVLRKTIDSLKQQYSIKGRTIQVADKGLNCSENIAHALLENDGYIFSKSVKMLPAVETEWVLWEEGYKDIKDAEGKVLYKVKECVGDFEYTVKAADGKPKKVLLREKRVATFNPKLASKQIYEINREVEKARKLCASAAKRSEYGDCGKYVQFASVDKNGEVTEEKTVVRINEDAIERAKRLAGYNLLVSSETRMSAGQIYEIYHNLWRIEESFRIMKSELDARPVFLQKQETITGHFLICYLAVVLTRLLQFKELKNESHSEELFDFFRDFRVAKISENQYLNLTGNCRLINRLAQTTRLPLTSYLLSEADLRKILSFKF